MNCRILIICFFLYSCHTQQIKEPRPTSDIMNVMPNHFVSFAIDLAQIAGGKWWEGSSDFSMGRGGKNSNKLNFKREKLVALTSSLSPSIIRAGGSEADSIYYGLDEDESIPKGFQTILSKRTWDDFYEFTRTTGNIPLFTLNIGPGYRKNNQLSYVHFHKFFSYLRAHQHDMKYFELGNELNAFFLNYGLSGQVSAKQYAGEYLKVKKILKSYFPKSKLLGPANAFWPFLGEVFSSFSTSSKDIVKYLKNHLDILSWHFYPTQSHRCPVNVNRASEYSMTHPTTVGAIDKVSDEVKEMTKRDGIESWLGETGPAQCGGEPSVSTSFSSSLWWIDFIGKISQTNNKVMIRQTLIGSDYGIVDNETLNVRHDFLSTYLFKSLRASYSLNLVGDRDHVYSYCSKDGIHHLLIVNMKHKNVEYNLSHFMDNNSYDAIVIDELASKSIIDKINEANQFDSSMIEDNVTRMDIGKTLLIKKRAYAFLSSKSKSSICSSLVAK